MLKNKRVFVTGASGFIGRHLCAALHKEGAFVIGMVKSSTATIIAAEKYCEDICNAVAVRKLLLSIQPDYVVHLAASKNRGTGSIVYRETYETNLIGSLNLIDACHELPLLSRFVSLGSTDEYGNLSVPFLETNKEEPLTAYGASKLAVTDLLRSLSRSNGFSGVVLRPTIAYGPGQDFSMFLPSLVNCLVSGKTFEMSLGEQMRDFIYIDDLVRAIISSLSVYGISGRVINISSGLPIQIKLLAKMTANMVGDEAENLLRFGAKNYRAGDLMQYWASNTLAKEILGWSPQISLREGVGKIIDHFKAGLTDC